MKRPFAVIGISALTAAILAVMASTAVHIFLMAACLAVFVVFTVAKKKEAFKSSVPAALITVLLALLAYNIAYGVKVAPYLALDNTRAEITAAIRNYPVSEYGKYYYELNVEELYIDGEKISMAGFKTRMSSNVTLGGQPGDRIKTTVTFYTYDSKEGYSSGANYNSKGIVLGCYQERNAGFALGKAEKISIRASFLRLRNNLTAQLGKLFSEEYGGFISTVALGDKSALSPETENAFRKTGVSHILVVSGFHMAMVAGFIYLFLKNLKIPGWIKHGVTILLIIAYMLLTGLSVSVLRSGLMITFLLLSRLAGSRADSLNSLGISITVMFIMNPLIGGDIGYLMSVFATLGIIVFSKPIEDFLMKPFNNKSSIKRLVSAISVGMGAVVPLLPIQILMFGEISLLAPFLTLLLSLPVTALIYLSFVLLFCSYFTPLAFAVKMMSVICGGIIRLITAVTGFFASFNFLTVDTSESYWVIPTGGILCICAVLFIRKSGGGTKALALLLSLSLIFTSFALNYIRYKDAVIVAIPNCSGDSSVVLMKNGSAAVLSIGCYNESAVTDVLERNGIKRVEAVIISKSSGNSVNALKNLSDQYQIENLYVAENCFLSNGVLDKINPVKMERLEARLSITVFGDMEIVREKWGQIYFDIEGTRFVVEDGKTRAEIADVLITNMKKTLTTSTFTVSQLDDILVPEANLKSTYVFACERDATYLEFFKGEEMQIRGED